MAKPVKVKHTDEEEANATRRLRVFKGAVAIVTGGASGIGKALAQELAKRGAAAIVLVDRQAELAEEVAAELELKNKDVKTKVYDVDVRKFDDVQRVVTETVEVYGSLDYLFNNAGTMVSGTVEQIGVDDFNYILDVNVRGVANGVHAAYPIMKEQGFGHIVNTASIAGLAPFGEGSYAYGTSKYAVVGLSMNLRVEAARHGVHVSAICPGVIDTPLVQGKETGTCGKYGKDKSGFPRDAMDEIVAKFKPMDPNKFAVRTLKLVAKNKPIIVFPGQPYKMMWFMNRISPSLGLYLATKNNNKFMKWLEKKRDEIRDDQRTKIDEQVEE